jgi:hypothetical protein
MALEDKALTILEVLYAQQPDKFSLSYAQVLANLAFVHRSRWRFIKMFQLLNKAIAIANEHDIEICKIMMKC